MAELIRARDLAIRLMHNDLADCELMARWLSDPRVLEFYDGRDCPLSLAEASEKYSSRTLGADGVTPCLLILEAEPVGYIQYYPLNDENKGEYEFAPSTDVSGFYSFDQFIGEPELWNKGLGTRFVSLIAEHLFQGQGARKIVIDPQARNPRAIRCYEKCGFHRVKLLPAKELHEGNMEDCWLMEMDRPRSL